MTQSQQAVSVLITDDDPDIRELLRDILEETGYTVYEAADGVDVLETLRDAQEHMVVLLDLFMPYLDGSQVIERILDDPYLARRHVIILMTARYQALPPGLPGLLSSAGLPMIAKPFDFDELLAAIANATLKLSA